ncbi:MAG: DUF2924 domain-containing protein [Planctomycetaceae bacterium]|nr:DUF2924 domain-containing protein [Planctomycetaceae bacterium]
MTISKPFDINAEVAAMQRLSAGQLQEKYAEVCGEPARSRHRQWLIRRIAWRLQANAEGDLSERARRRAEEFANDADARVTPPRTVSIPVRVERVDEPLVFDSRLPNPGTTLFRTYKGRQIEVHIRADGFEYAGDLYKSLSAVAKAVTGSHMNGFRFFKLEESK